MFGGSSTRWHLFTLGGHRVYLEPFFLILIAIFVFMGLNEASQLANQLMWAPILFIGVLFHEFGHAVVTKRLGFGPSTIILQGLGGVAINESKLPRKPGQSVLISLAGPSASLLLALVSYVALIALRSSGGGPSTLMYFLELNTLINVFWAGFNMLPINPMDGGHVVLHSLRKFFPIRKALYYSAVSSLVVLALVGVAGLAIGYQSFILIVIVLMFGMQNVQIIKQLKAMD